MKMRKNLWLEAAAVARGERAARERKLSLSALVEKQLLAIPTLEEEDEFWPGTPGIPVSRPGEPRYENLRRKHR